MQRCSKLLHAVAYGKVGLWKPAQQLRILDGARSVYVACSIFGRSVRSALLIANALLHKLGV